MKKLIILLFVVFVSCKKDNPQPVITSNTTPTTQTVSVNDTTHYVMMTGYDD